MSNWTSWLGWTQCSFNDRDEGDCSVKLATLVFTQLRCTLGARRKMKSQDFREQYQSWRLRASRILGDFMHLVPIAHSDSWLQLSPSRQTKRGHRTNYRFSFPAPIDLPVTIAQGSGPCLLLPMLYHHWTDLASVLQLFSPLLRFLRAAFSRCSYGYHRRATHPRPYCGLWISRDCLQWPMCTPYGCEVI